LLRILRDVVLQILHILCEDFNHCLQPVTNIFRKSDT
jgi:hypothetical protein